MSRFTIPRTEQSDPFYRYTMPAMSLKVEGRGKMIKTKITNIEAVARALSIQEDREGSVPTQVITPAYIIQWFALALSTKADDDYVSGERQAIDLQNELDRFISIFVCCPTCEKPEFSREVDGEHIIGCCRACGWSGPLKTAGNRQAERFEKFIARDLTADTNVIGKSRRQKKAALQSQTAKAARATQANMTDESDALARCSELQEMKPSRLRKLAKEKGANEQSLEMADDAEDAVSVLVDLIISLEAQSDQCDGRLEGYGNKDSDETLMLPVPDLERCKSVASSSGLTPHFGDLQVTNTFDERTLTSIAEERDIVIETSCTSIQACMAALAPEAVAGKQRERYRMKHGKAREKEAMSEDIDFSTHTKHAPGNAVKAESLFLHVGNAHLLEDTKLTVSEGAGGRACYGLIGPNGCGKTTLMRLIAGYYAPQHVLPKPSSWDIYLVDQLDPEPTGRSPLEEVLASCSERAELLEQQKKLDEEMDLLATLLDEGRNLSQEELSRINTIADELEILQRKLSYFDKDVQDVTRILVGLGFSDGEEFGADGAPSLRKKDEIITDVSNLELSSCVEVRDQAHEEWLRGMVTSICPLKVQPDGWRESFEWVEIRHSSELSGGWRKKVNLAKALYAKPRLLLLDEPTNHLDFHALLWLEEELEAYPHVVLIVSHNGEFLANVCDKVLHIENQKIETIPMKELSPEDIASKQRQVEAGSKHKEWRFAYPQGDNPELHGLSFHGVAFRYNPGGPCVVEGLDHDTLRFSGRSRSVLLGRNGSGKSTILKLALGVIDPTCGTVDGRHGDYGGNCKVGHFSQHFNEELDRHPHETAAIYLAHKCKAALEEKFFGGKLADEEFLKERATEVLGWFGLPPDAARKRSLRDLSGGQKARVNFAFLSLEPVHLIFLDEPTNHLDASGLEYLAKAVKGFQGGIVLVSHDEVLIRKVLNSTDQSRLLVCKDGRVSAQQPNGSQGLDSYRKIALWDQHERIAKAQADAAKRLEEERRKSAEAVEQARSGRRGRGRKRGASAPLSAVSSVTSSPALSREPSPTPPFKEPFAPQPEPKKNALGDLFKKKSSKKIVSMNLNKTS